MKPRLLLCSLALIFAAVLPAAETSPASAVTLAAKPPVFVSVHGAWAGGWQFKRTAVLLEAKGWKVYRPSLSGLGEHYNTASADIGLQTHIDDVVNFILFEDLHDVIRSATVMAAWSSRESSTGSPTASAGSFTSTRSCRKPARA